MTGRGRAVLVVEDDYFIADDLRHAVMAWGAEVVGPAAGVSQALRLIEARPRIDAAILDINLGGESVFPVADVLAARGVKFGFATGYDARAVPPRFAKAPRWEKPVNARAIMAALLG